MGIYHVLPYEYLIGRLIFYICLYGSITCFLLHLRYNSLERKYKRYYLIASIFSIGKMIYHVWIAIVKFKYEKYLIDYEGTIIQYQSGLANYDQVLLKYNKAVLEHNFNILGIECELFAAIFTGIIFLTLILLHLNNGRLFKK